MTLNNTKSNNRGFTLVELLIVIVVIAILAAISLVAYNGVQNRARTTTATAALSTVVKKAEAANTVAGKYPASLAEFTAQPDSSMAGSGIVLAGFTTTAPPEAATVEYIACANGSGATVSYWDYTRSTGNKISRNIGTTTTACTGTALVSPSVNGSNKL